MKSNNRIRAFRNQLKTFRLPFFIFLLFWIIGFVVFYIIEENKNFWNIVLTSICVNESTHTFYNFYQFLWPLLFELLILTFILSALQEFYGYNPIVNSRKLAKGKKNHTVVLGHNHLGARIVEHLRKHKRPYTVVDINHSNVDDLISQNQPVVVGDYTDINIIKLAGIEKCKEVFCVTRDLRRALIGAEKVRELNQKCALYMRVFDDHFRTFLAGEPWNAFTFSSSKWAMESVQNWAKDIDNDKQVIILGNDTLVHRLVEYFGTRLKVKVNLIDPDIDHEVYQDFPNVNAIEERVQFIENLNENFDMDKISQIYICWNTAELFSDAIILTVALRKEHPHIDVIVRMFDEELAEIAKFSEAKTFSTSAYAFQMLQKEVKKDSGIYHNLE